MSRNKNHKPAPLRRPAWTPFVESAVYNGARQFRNSRYHVGVKEYDGLLHLSIKHLLPGPLNYLQDWRDYQRIKNELADPEMEAIQIFPAESRLVDGANQFHLWVLKVDKIPLGFPDRLVTEGDLGIGVTQRPFDADARPADVTTPRFHTHPLAMQGVD